MANKNETVGVRLHYHSVDQAVAEFDGLAKLARQFNVVSLPDATNLGTVPLEFRTAAHRRGFYDTLLSLWRQGESQFGYAEFVPAYG